MPETIALPSILYLLLLDRLGDSWTYGRAHYPYAFWHYRETLDLMHELSFRVSSKPAATRLTA